jgi:hypothetical protein
MLFWIYILLYSVARFFIQFYRVDTPFALGLSQAQLLSILSAMVAVWALVFQYQRYRRHGPAHGPASRAAQPPGVPSAPAKTSESESESDDGEEVAEHAPLSG